MLHREGQIKIPVEKYDIVRARVYLKPIAGRMNSFNKTIEHQDFYGYGIITGASDSFCNVYLPNRESKLFRKENLIVAIKYKKNK